MHSRDWRTAAVVGRPVAVHRLDALDHQPIAVPQHEHLAGGRNPPRDVDDQPVAVAHLRCHRITPHPEDPQVVRVRIALVAGY